MNLGSIDLVILDEIGEAIKEKNPEFTKGRPSEMPAAIRKIGKEFYGDQIDVISASHTEE